VPSIGILCALVGACGNGGGTSAGPGASSGGNGGTSIVSTGLGGAAGSTTIDPDAACNVTSETTAAVSSDIFIMQDRSGSMECPAADDTCQNPTQLLPPTRWDAVTDAVQGFISAPSSVGIGVGIGFFGFPVGTRDAVSCNAADYAKPTTPIRPLPANASAISAAIAATKPAGSTPTVPALTGALEYAKTYAKGAPGRTVAVVLVTDGTPTNCTGNTVNAAATLAAQALGGTPPIKTYVIGLGNTSALDQIALAGSGGAAHYFPASGDVATRLGAALRTIAGMVTCRYAIPSQGGIPLDTSLINVRITIGPGGTPTQIGKVNDVSACGMKGGWYYDDNAKPAQIILCRESCDPVKATPESRVQILYGCPSLPPS
jgi:hypothetical protein